jgi:hypothetical protein
MDEIPHTIQIEHLLTKDDLGWIEILLKYNDFFHPSCIGYWAYGVRRNKWGWLIYVDDHNAGAPCSEEQEQEWLATRRVTSGQFYLIDRDVALKALKYGLNKWGVNFTNGNCDYVEYDLAIQNALFNNIVYG